MCTLAFRIKISFGKKGLLKYTDKSRKKIDRIHDSMHETYGFSLNRARLNHIVNNIEYGSIENVSYSLCY